MRASLAVISYEREQHKQSSSDPDGAEDCKEILRKKWKETKLCDELLHVSASEVTSVRRQ